MLHKAHPQSPYANGPSPARDAFRDTNRHGLGRRRNGAGALQFAANPQTGDAGFQLRPFVAGRGSGTLCQEAQFRVELGKGALHPAPIGRTRADLEIVHCVPDSLGLKLPPFDEIRVWVRRWWAIASGQCQLSQHNRLQWASQQSERPRPRVHSPTPPHANRIATPSAAGRMRSNYGAVPEDWGFHIASPRRAQSHAGRLWHS